MNCFPCITRIKSFFNNEPRIKQQLAILYKDKFQESIFYEVCQSSLRFITSQSHNQFVQEQGERQRLTSRKSVTSVSHYENSNLNFNSQNGMKKNTDAKRQSKDKIGIPNTIQYMSITEKQTMLKELIQKSYLFVDLSDLFSGEDLQTYENIVRAEVFEGEESIVESILESYSKKGVNNKLKYFDSQALHLLKIYVDFCTQTITKYRPSAQLQNENRNHPPNFFPRLILQLKAKLQLQFPDERVVNKFSQLNNLVSEYRVMNNIILSTLQKISGIHIIPESSHEYAENFFTYPNMSTLVSVILFMDENFLKAIYGRFIEGLKVCSGRMADRLNINQQSFVQQLKLAYFGIKIEPRQSINKSSTHALLGYKSNLQKILQGSSQLKFPYFKNSLRTLETLTSQKQPIKCLKIIYELNKTIQIQHTEFIKTIIQQQSEYDLSNDSKNQKGNRQSQYDNMRMSQRSKKYSFSREIEYVIIEFLLAKKKDKIRFIIANIMITYFFVHQNMLKDKKGSCLMPFVDIVQNLGLNMNTMY